MPRSTSFARACATRWLPRAEGDGRLGPDAVPAEAAPHAGERPALRRARGARARATTSSFAPRCCASRARRGRSGCPASRCPPRSATKPVINVRASSTRSRASPSPAARAARPRVTRSHRIEEFCRANDVIGLPDEPLADHLDAGLHARLRRRVPRIAGPARQGPVELLLDHAARRVDRTARRSSRTCARTTTGCSACWPSTRACPATTSSWRGPIGRPNLARGVSSAAACSPRAGPST